MSVLQLVEGPPVAVDPLVARLDVILAELGAAVADTTDVADAVRIDRIDRLERLRAVTAAAQAAECARFAQSQAAQQLAADVHPRTVGRGIADQIALACRISPVAGSRQLNTARAWWFDPPATYGLLTAGKLSEQVTEIVAAETRHLDAATRRAVDSAVAAAGITATSTKPRSHRERHRAGSEPPAENHRVRGRRMATHSTW